MIAAPLHTILTGNDYTIYFLVNSLSAVRHYYGRKRQSNRQHATPTRGDATCHRRGGTAQTGKGPLEHILFKYGVEGGLDYAYNSLLKEALSSHLKSGIRYRVSIMVDRNKRNVTVLRNLIIGKLNMTEDFPRTIRFIRETI